MSYLRIFADSGAEVVHFEGGEVPDICRELAPIGVQFERWTPLAEVTPGASNELILQAFRPQIDQLMNTGGYVTVDVVSLAPDHPEREAFRQKFLNEHTHAEDEVRFFVAGAGLFTLHVADRVYEVHCVAGDLIRVPAGTKHWFDMGERPSFVALRLFNNPAGWVANFTSDDIATRFPRFEPHA